MAQTGYTLPVFAVAAAKAALVYLLEDRMSQEAIAIDLMPETAEIPVRELARLDPQSALAITLSDPRDNLDLTRNTPIWAWVKLTDRLKRPLILQGGEGLGKTATGKAAIYKYARQLFDNNLSPLIPADKSAHVRIILPEGRQLAKRTSNEAFGILEGLALLGTSGISQPLSAADRLEDFRQTLQEKVKTHPNLVFCLGSNGQQVARRLNIDENALVQTGNWLGALLVEAGLRGARSVLLIGYQGKLIKLAGGIFNTSSHVADGKLEILASATIRAGGDRAAAEAVLGAKTADSAYHELVRLGLAKPVFEQLAGQIRTKAIEYVKKYADASLEIGVILFDRKGHIIASDSAFENLVNLLQQTQVMGEV
jgi:cobalt-precorrin-5B (C1)-methyltransferase